VKPLTQALPHLQPSEDIKTLADMKVTLKELCWLLRDERRGLTELQQQFAKAKATWETERAELKSHAAQVSPYLAETLSSLFSQALSSSSECRVPKPCSWRLRNHVTSPVAQRREETCLE
jgi:hypothetical protein